MFKKVKNKYIKAWNKLWVNPSSGSKRSFKRDLCVQKQKIPTLEWSSEHEWGRLVERQLWWWLVEGGRGEGCIGWLSWQQQSGWWLLQWREYTPLNDELIGWWLAYQLWSGRGLKRSTEQSGWRRGRQGVFETREWLVGHHMRRHHKLRWLAWWEW